MNKPVCIWLGVEFSPEKWCQFPKFQIGTPPKLQQNRKIDITPRFTSSRSGNCNPLRRKLTLGGFTCLLHMFFCKIFNLEMDEHRWWTMQLFQVSSNSYVNIQADSSTAKVPLPVDELHDYFNPIMYPRGAWNSQSKTYTPVKWALVKWDIFPK